MPSPAKNGKNRSVGNASPTTVILPATAPSDTPGEMIRVRGARTHNLKNVDIDIPRDALTVITGVSGSGKSSLAFDTIFAEGQRQYVESLSVYARQFLDQMERPEVDLIDNLQPTISIDQRTGSHNPRSTVATITEIYDYMRLLWARVGRAHCYQCGLPISQQTPEEIERSLLALPEGTRLMILAPLVRGRRGAHQDAFDKIRKGGFLRARVDGETYELGDVPELAPRKNHTIEAVVDRIIIRDAAHERLPESIRDALRLGEGVLIATIMQNGTSGGARAKLGNGTSSRGSKSNGNGRGAGQKTPNASSDADWVDRIYSTRYACGACQISFESLEPRSFSFNSPYGACPTCQGLGSSVEFDPDLVIPDRELSLASGAVAPWRGATAAAAKRYRRQLDELLARTSIDADTPIDQLPAKRLEKLLRGNGGKQLGLLTLLEKEYVTSTSAKRREQLETFRGQVLCAACAGARLRPEARCCQIDGRAIHEVAALTVAEASSFFDSIEFDDYDAQIATPVMAEIVKRLKFLAKVGVEYLSLDRAADTLSGGEMQRVRLATGIGSSLVNVCYLLDEPSIGLHPRDNRRLIDALRDLQQLGNTVVVVEHDEAIMREADHLIDMGPGAGRLGGQLVAAGTPAQLQCDAASLTGQYLSGAEQIALPAARRRTAKSRSIQLDGASLNNLQSVNVRVPLGVLVCVTGVSGSGKSSLVTETLSKALTRRLTGAGHKPGPLTSLRGVNQIDRLVEVDQSPIGRTPRSNPATYTGVFDEIRKVFAGTKESKQRGYKSGRFSFNVKGGRCDKCQGQGVEKIEMNFLPDLFVTCAECNGRRFNRQTLAVRYRDHSIADVLDLSVDDAAAFFENHPVIHRLLEGLQSVSLGYITLGQASTTLSGGEAQRIKLATELSRPNTSATLYVLDEPTTGLHHDDIRKLLAVLSRLVDLGNTVLVIEHNLDVIKCADWVIDLGPEGGEQGGRIVAAGTPEEVASVDESHTGRYLRDVLTL